MNKLLEIAKERYGNIRPCHGKCSFEECITIEDNKIILWFNTNDDSTHIVVSTL